jgi:S-adenosylmethionine hydrolase
MPSPVPTPTVFFLSDYGTQDEFVGVVHAVLHRAGPGLTIIDLTHEIPAFDVRAGANTLTRAVPHLGSGVVLAVVDPGVGSRRRGLCLEVTPEGGDGPQDAPSFFVGPDNGLLLEAAELVGNRSPVARAFALSGSGSGTFDGRDVFAPAAAALCGGKRPEDLGEPIDPQSLVRLPRREPELVQSEDGRRILRVEVTWVDRFGNVQLAALAALAALAGLADLADLAGLADLDSLAGLAAEAGDTGVPPPGPVGLTTPAARSAPETTLRRVRTFADLAPGELGLLIDANGHLAVVAGEASAARALNVGIGDVVVLTWEKAGRLV